LPGAAFRRARGAARKFEKFDPEEAFRDGGSGDPQHLRAAIAALRMLRAVDNPRGRFD
jgi:hypothetical protein